MERVIRLLKNMAVSAVCIGLAAGCSTTQRTTQSPRTAIEQLLISEAVLRSLPAESQDMLSIPSGAGVILNTAGISPDQALLQKILVGWLGKQGFSVQKDEKNATYRINVIVNAMGTEFGSDFFGMPPASSQFIPISLPELAIYKAQFQTGYVKFYLDIFKLPSEQFVQSTPVFLAETYYNNHTLLLFISFTRTDLASPPQMSIFRKAVNTGDTPTEDVWRAVIP
ncbi:hypothetical protein [Nitrosospira briensis]|uniref:hypothetical protein n=1 Tax=Nitrosospira briensis TaxID=35799 RepID=UPI00046AC80F|nr:hypothetical protein [Nitrosospira briensis]